MVSAVVYGVYVVPFCPANRTDFRILWTGWTGNKRWVSGKPYAIVLQIFIPSDCPGAEGKNKLKQVQLLRGWTRLRT